ncbi:hypothetical protein NIES2111_56370 (plasmid) [Nostoc sp. NIES-2111]|nr:hypothetical protein NIES2111_56370 [Nostoc sp. NIES-2111]
MFDERHLQLTSAYDRASQHFIRAFIYPLGEFIYKSIEEAIDLKCRIEIGEATYFLTPDEDGGWKWSKGEQEITNEEVEQIEGTLEYLLPRLLPGSHDSTPPNFPPPPDLPPVLPNPNIPPSLPPSGELVDFLAIQIESNNTLEYQYLQSQEQIFLTPPNWSNDYVINDVIEIQDISITSSTEIVDDSSVLDDANPDKDYEQSQVINSHKIADEHLTVELISNNTIPIRSENLRPEHIDPQHWHELVVDSAIAPEIAQMNFQSLHFSQTNGSHEAWERLMISENLPRTNTGRLSGEILRKYSYLDFTDGWWCNAGVDPRTFLGLNPGETAHRKEWGCYKPNQPRPKTERDGQIIEGKFIKYEHPPKTQLSIFLLDVPDKIAQNIYSKAGVNPSDSDKKSGFWYCVWKHNVPITITEGAKKAASLLSQGHAAIGLPGISAGYRTPKNEWGQKIDESYLAQELAVFATKSREIKICFDYETKPETKLNIDRDTWKTGSLLQEFGSVVKVVMLPGPDKGVDDFLVSQGREAFENLSARAISLEQWNKNKFDNLRCTLKLKDGTVKTISEHGDSTVTTNACENEPEQDIGVFKKTRAKSLINPSSQIIHIKVTDAEIIDVEVVSSRQHQPLEETTLQNTSGTSWAKKENVTLYEPNFFRKRLEAGENKQIASAAYSLLKKYGVEVKDEQQQTSGKIYHADAFVIKNHGGDKYSIYRRHDDVELMTFQADKWGHVGNIKLSYTHTQIKNAPTTQIEKRINILPIERQEFLLVADVIKTGKELPSLDSDPRKIASTLSSLSPQRTHNILESFKEKEVLQILTQTITSFGKDDLTLGNYRILFGQSSDTTSTLQLLKTEHNGITREAVRFEFERTETGITHQVKALAITEADLEKLRLLAQKLHINYQALFGNPNNTRDIDLPLHPAFRQVAEGIAKQWDNLDSRQSSFSTSSIPKNTTPIPKTTAPSQSTKRQNYSFNLDNVVLPLHPVLKQYWEQLEKDGSLNKLEQGHLEFQSKIQQTGTLTVGEQSELYQQIQNQAWNQINCNGRTDIVLPPLAQIVNDLRSLSLQQSQPNISSDPSRDIPMPLHRDIAAHWENLETNNTWSSVANQYNNPLRDKLEKTGKLTIGEQRELYQKIFLQSQVEQHNKGKTDISLPPLSDIVQELMNTRNQIINDTYTPKVEVHSPQKSHTPQQSTNSQELEL